MALDGIYLYSLINELKTSIINSKIDKINQPEKDEIIITLRGREQKKLLISSSSNYPRIHFTTIPKNNPLKPPVFCMVLRKYLIGGRIVDIHQCSTDRIIFIDVENKDELGFDSIYTLVIEIMARHSNITLVRKRDNKVMESIKHITAIKNSYRVLYPGVTYVLPPNSTKLNPLDFSMEELKIIIKENKLEFDKTFFSKVLTGVGKNFSLYLFNLFNDEFNNDVTIENIFSFIKNIFKDILEQNKNIIFLQDGKMVDFYFKDLDLENKFNKVYFENHSCLLDQFYATKDKQDRLHGRSLNIQKLLNTNVERCLKKINILDNILEECNNKTDFKLKGELLTSYIYSFKKGDKYVEVSNYYSDNNELLKINLDENKTPSENVQYYFKKYNKLKTAEKAAIIQLAINEEELKYLNSVLTSLQTADNYIDIDEIKKELIETGYIKFRKLNKKEKIKVNKPLHFISSDGLDIYVGKNNTQNDFLTLKFADKNDTWLHTKNIPGSHVIIKGTIIPENTLKEGALLAAYYSKGTNSVKVPIDYTLVKNVKKPSGSKPGMVIYSTNKTIYIDPPAELKLKKID